MNSLHDEHCGTLQKFPHCRNLPEHFKLTPRTLRNPSKPQIPLQNLAPEWNPRTFQSQNITAIRTFRNFLRPRSSKSFSKSCICHAKTFQWYPPRKRCRKLPLRHNRTSDAQSLRSPVSLRPFCPPPCDGRCCVGCTRPWMVPRPRHTRLWPCVALCCVEQQKLKQKFHSIHSIHSIHSFMQKFIVHSHSSVLC